ncbi:hypothetical protein AKJ09_01896 [Labilithrix luteola]|uniref:PEGA domain-containing protein n=1 Tax=Labilithrix luteola TaxID=1391654 RepID=A0A0K1PP00_9BACT|nr:tetratricopeptide repeat protein [Labilithrix luteola]AKU95232.1 hypothetical protein AKJ09_01896 [Labilithrix luteola]
MGQARVARAADGAEGGAAAAESLFQEARKLTEAKRYGEACPKFLASHKLAPAVGTLLNLADCYEKNGQLASAWSRFHEAIALAQHLGRSDREKTAKERADKLEPRLLRLTITSEEPTVDVTLDGNALDPAVLGTALPVDPGKHTVEASTKGKKPFSTTIDVSERSKSSAVEIPRLEVDESAKADMAKPPADYAPAETTTSDGKPQRILGLVAIGAGVVGLGVGGYFGLRTNSKWSEAQEHCKGVDCDATGVDLAQVAKNDGTISTIAFIAGGALAVGGLVLVLTAPNKSSSSTGASTANTASVNVGVGPGSVLVGGRF